MIFCIKFNGKLLFRSCIVSSINNGPVYSNTRLFLFLFFLISLLQGNTGTRCYVCASVRPCILAAQL
jgi:hypothetical protein